jgi:hypothetical protein
MLDELTLEILIDNPCMLLVDATHLAKYEYLLGRRPRCIPHNHPAAQAKNLEKTWASWTEGVRHSVELLAWRQDSESLPLGHHKWLSMVEIDGDVDLVCWAEVDTMFGWKVTVLSDGTVVWPKNPYNEPKFWHEATICHKAVGFDCIKVTQISKYRLFIPPRVDKLMKMWQLAASPPVGGHVCQCCDREQDPAGRCAQKCALCLVAWHEDCVHVLLRDWKDKLNGLKRIRKPVRPQIFENPQVLCFACQHVWAK